MTMYLRFVPVHSILTYSAVFLLTTLELGLCELRVPNRRNRRNYGFVREGDLNVGQLVGFTAGSTCSQFQPSGVLYSKVVQFAVGQINRRTDLLPNITLGFVQLDDCWGSLTAVEAAVYLIGDDGSQDYSNTATCRPFTWNSTDGSFYPTSFDVVGVVGPAVSTFLIAVAQVLAVFQIPTIGLVSTVNSLSDKTSYPYTLRLVPPDLAQEQAILKIARDMGWTYVSMVYSAGAYGDGAFNDFQSMLRSSAASYGICLAVTVRIPTAATEADYDYAVKQLASDPSARVVITYLHPDPDLSGLLSAVRRLVGVGWFVWLGSDTFGSLKSKDYADLLEGAIYSTYIAGNSLPGFQQFFESLPYSGADMLDTNPVILSVLSELLDQSKVERSQPALYVNYVELYCSKTVAWFLVQLSYNMILMVICASLGFRSRHLPENFNDSQFIFISVATTVFVWILFVPAYFTAYYAYLRSIIIGFCLVSNVIVTLVCQFVRIVYAVFFVPTEQIKFNMVAEGGTSNQVASSTVPASSAVSVVTKKIQLERARHSSSCDQ